MVYDYKIIILYENFYNWISISSLEIGIGYLIDKFSGLTDDLEDVGRHLKSVEKSFLGAQNKLYEGQGNLFNQMKDLEKLGAKNKKNLKQPKKNLLEE